MEEPFLTVVEPDFGNRPSIPATMTADKSTLRDGWEFYWGCMLKARALFFGGNNASTLNARIGGLNTM